MKHREESEIEFQKRIDAGKIPKYPDSRTIVIRHYGGDVEKCIEAARKEFNLGPEWTLIHAEGSE